MKPARTFAKILPWIISAMLLFAAAAMGQEAPVTDNSDGFTSEELTQMLAPIALYPDALIAQILMASTYPLEIVEAERWLRGNKDLTGSRLDEALREKGWDVSVKSLCHFPDLLIAMSDKLDQTRKLGDAFLVQEKEIMATIQELRRKADSAGNLKSSREQKVIVEPDIIRIEPAEAEVVYLPVYDPFYVYGPWWYPAFPPYYWYYPPGFVGGGFVAFGPRIYFGPGFFSWAWFDWPVYRIRIDFQRTRTFHHSRIRYDSPYWRHDAGHRRGVAYRDRRTSERFGARPLRLTPTTPETRGFPVRGSALAAPRQAGERQQGAVVPFVKKEQGKTVHKPGGDTPFRGIGEGRFERKAGERGGESRRPGGELRRPAGDRQQHRGRSERGR